MSEISRVWDFFVRVMKASPFLTGADIVTLQDVNTYSMPRRNAILISTIEQSSNWMSVDQHVIPIGFSCDCISVVPDACETIDLGSNVIKTWFPENDVYGNESVNLLNPGNLVEIQVVKPPTCVKWSKNGHLYTNVQIGFNIHLTTIGNI